LGGFEAASRRRQGVREQLAPTRRQERKRAARLQEMPRYRPRIQQLTLTVRSTLHTEIIARNPAGGSRSRKRSGSAAAWLITRIRRKSIKFWFLSEPKIQFRRTQGK